MTTLGGLAFIGAALALVLSCVQAARDTNQATQGWTRDAGLVIAGGGVLVSLGALVALTIELRAPWWSGLLATAIVLVVIAVTTVIVRVYRWRKLAAAALFAIVLIAELAIIRAA